jgi:hypothetical protein
VRAVAIRDPDRVHPESCAPANQMRATAALPPGIRTYPEYLREAGYYCTNNSKTDFNCDADASKIFDESSSTAHYRKRPAGKPFFAIFNHMTSHESSLLGGGRRGGTAPAGSATPDQVRVPAYLPDTPEVRADIAQYYNAIERMDAEIGAKIRAGSANGAPAGSTTCRSASSRGAVRSRSCTTCRPIATR